MADNLPNFYPDDFNNILEPFFLGVGLIDRDPPDFTTYLLYNLGGVLYWSGSPVGGGGAGLWQEEGGVGPNIYYSAGDVAIGKTSASYPLDVHGVVKTDDDVILANAKEIQFQDNIGGLTAYITRDSNNDLALVNSTSGKDIELTTNGGKVVIIGSLAIQETGSTDLATITVASLGAARAYGIIDAGGAADFLMTAGAQTVTGAKTFASSALLLQEAGSTDVVTVAVATLGAGRTYTVPDAGGAANFILSTSSPAQGDILYFNGTTWASLTAGTARYNLETGGGGANPSWGLNPALVTFEPTGFPNRTDSTISISTRAFTIAPAVTSFDFYVQGVKFTKTGTPAQTVTIQDVAGQLNYIYYNSSGTLSQGTSLPNLGQNALVATAYWNGTTALLCEERHGLTMDWATHYYLHHNTGVVWSSGLAGTFNDDNTFSIALGEIDDEDNEISITPAQTTCRVLYRDVALGTTMSFGAIGTAWWAESGGVIAYDNAGTLDPVPATNYVSYWIFASPDTACPIYSLVGQRIDATLATAKTNQTYLSLDLSSLPNNEMKLLYRVLVQNVGGTETIIELDDRRSTSNRSLIQHAALGGLAVGDDHMQYLLHDRTSDVQGQVLYHNGTGWVSLAPGTDGYYLQTRGASANPRWSHDTQGDLIEATSSILTITGGTNAVMGSGTTIQVDQATSLQAGYLSATDWQAFDAKYDGLPSQGGNAGKYLTTNGAVESWAAIVSSAVAGYVDISFGPATSATITHNFGARPIVQVVDSTGAVLMPLSITHTNTNVFVVTFSVATTGSIIASVGSPYISNVISKGVDYTLQSGDTVVMASTAIILTLPTAVGITGKTYTLKNVSAASNVTAKGTGAELIDTDNEFIIPPSAAICVVSDGAQWRVW